MANHYYVRDDGLAPASLAPFATAQTGSMTTLGTANFFASIQLAIECDTPPVGGDFIHVSDLHSFVTAANITYTGLAPIPFFIVCVDDANIDQSRTSGNMAFEETTGILDIIISNCLLSGISLKSSDNIVGQGSVLFQDCKLNVTGSGDIAFTTSGDGVSGNFINTEISCDNAGGLPFAIASGSTVSFVGGSITTISAGLTAMVSGGFVSGGGSLYMYGSEISAVTGTLIANVGGSGTTDDAIDVRLDMCRIASGVAFTNEDFKSYNQRALFTRCSDSSAAAEHQYHLHAFGGDVDDDSAIFRNEDPAFADSGQKISYKIVTNSDASLAFPLWFDFPNPRFSELSVGASDTLRIFANSNTALTDKDIYPEISYSDGVNKQTPKYLISGPATVGGTSDFMAAGTALTTDGVSTWTGALSNLFMMDADTSGGSGGADSVPIVRLNATIPSVTTQVAAIYENV